MKLTKAEKLLIQRRRANFNQVEAAKHYKVSAYRYKCWERGADDAPNYDVMFLHDYEKCFIHRMRAGISQEQLAAKTGFKSRMWIRLMEQGKVNCQPLTDYWHAA